MTGGKETTCAQAQQSEQEKTLERYRNAAHDLNPPRTRRKAFKPVDLGTVPSAMEQRAALWKSS